MEEKKCHVSGSDGCLLPDDKGKLVRNNCVQFSLNGSVSPSQDEKPSQIIFFFSSFKHIGANGSPGLSALALAGMDSKNGTDTAFIHQIGIESNA